jgi:hypothetical protein
MTELPVQGFSTDGTQVNYSSASDFGDEFPNNGKVLFIVKNESGDDTDVTFNTEITVEGEGVDNKVKTVSSNSTRIFGPFDQEVYDGDDGNVTASNYTNTTGVFVAAVQPNDLNR